MTLPVIHDDSKILIQLSNNSTQTCVIARCKLSAGPSFKQSVSFATQGNLSSLINLGNMHDYFSTYNPEAALTAEDLKPLNSGLGPAPTLIPGTFMPALNARNFYGIDREVQRTRNFTGIEGINNQDRAIDMWWRLRCAVCCDRFRRRAQRWPDIREARGSAGRG